MIEKTAPHDQLRNALWYASRGRESSLELHILSVRAADLAAVVDGVPQGTALLRPRDPAYVDELLGKVEAPIELLLRLARRA